MRETRGFTYPKSDIHIGHKAEVIITFMIRSLCLPKLKSITIILFDLSTINEKFPLSLLQLVCNVDVMSKLRTFSRVLVTVFKTFHVVLCILKRILFL